MKAQAGTYFFGRHRKMWGIWQWDNVTETGSTGIFIKDVRTYEDAVIEMYAFNGWTLNKEIKREF